MSQLDTPDYHFCTLNELQSPKPLPSLDFVAKLIDICHVPMTLFESSQRNIYDRKNHILYINNWDSYSRTLRDKYSRSVSSFQKQLKMMGFKKRKIKQHSSESLPQFKEQQVSQGKQNAPYADKDEIKRQYNQQNALVEQQQNNRNFKSQTLQQKKLINNDSKYMFVWRTNRSALIEKELQSFEEALSQEVSKAISLKEQMQKRRRHLDDRLQTLIFQSLLNTGQGQNSEIQTQINGQGKRNCNTEKESETILTNYLNNALKELKLLSNETQIQSKQFVSNISKNLSSELELYRMLIYKQTHFHKFIQEQ